MYYKHYHILILLMSEKLKESILIGLSLNYDMHLAVSVTIYHGSNKFLMLLAIIIIITFPNFLFNFFINKN